MAAAVARADDDRVAGRERAALAGADFRDGAGNFMADDGRHLAGNPSLDDFEIGMANTASFDLDQNFIRPDPRYLEVFDRHRFIQFM